MTSKQTLVCFSGPDRCGKTEIARELSRITGIPYFKASSERSTFLSAGWGVSASLEAAQSQAQFVIDEKKKRFDDIAKNRFLYDLLIADPRMIDLLKQTGQSIIMDRGFPCEKVYSAVMKRQTDLKALFDTDRSYSVLGTKIVICVRKSYEGIVDDIDPKVNSPVLRELDREYRKFASWTKCPTLLLEVDDEDLNREISEIRNFLGI